MCKKVAVLFLSVLFLGVSLETWADSGRRNEEKYVQRNRKNDCVENLNAFYKALSRYATLNKGSLPSKDNVEGLKELISHGISYRNFVCRHYKGKKYKFDDDSDQKDKKNKKNRDKKKENEPLEEKHSPYIYFGGINLHNAINLCPKLLIMCNKLNSSQHTLLFADGSVAEIVLSKKDKSVKSIADVVEYCHKKYKYPAAVLQVLRAKAKRFDEAYKNK